MKKSIPVLATILLLISATVAWSKGQSEHAAAGSAGSATNKPVVLPMLFRQGGNDAASQMYDKMIKLFEQKYKGVYKLQIEYVPGEAKEYRQKEQILASANELPVVVTNLAEQPGFTSQLISQHKLVNLKPYFDQDANWKHYALAASVAYNTNSNGKMYTGPESSARYIGIFYNKDLFAKAGIDAFPTTWGQFSTDLAKLKSAGITPISLHTTETGWCTNLMLTAYLGRNQAGREFMAIKYPSKQFTSPDYINAVEFAKNLFKYSTADAVGGTYALAANHFVHGDTAMIPNGPWMIPSFSDTTYSPAGFEKKVGYARFPGDLMISNEGAAYGDGVASKYPVAVQKGGVAWLEFEYADPAIIKLQMLAVGRMTPKIKLSNEELSKLGPVIQSYYAAVRGVKHTIPWFQAQWDPVTQNETIPKELPLLVFGNITPQQYVQALAHSASQYLASHAK